MNPDPEQDRTVLRQTSFADGMKRSAVFSTDNQFRYELVRTWDNGHEPLVFIMLNPSVADDVDDDPTIRRCIGFAKNAGYGGIHVVNLFGWIATYPDQLRGRIRSGMDCVGPDNDGAIRRAVAIGPVCAAWGLCPSWAEMRVEYVHRSLVNPARNLFVLGLTRDGHPRHPLYCPGDSRLQLWNPIS